MRIRLGVLLTIVGIYKLYLFTYLLNKQARLQTNTVDQPQLTFCTGSR